MHTLFDFIIFFAKTFTVLIAGLLLFAGIIALATKEKIKGAIKVVKLNKKFAELQKKLGEEILSKSALKKQLKAEKNRLKAEKNRKQIFLINFEGDIQASHVKFLREQITAVLTIATAKDEVVIKLESSGGLVHAYGLCASQLARLRSRHIPLTVIVDKVAASGGYLMACVADKIIAAPFAIIGSIGVVAQIPNFHRYLKQHHIDYEQHTAGEYKRTLTVFGENTTKAREKFQQDLEDIHVSFKDFIVENRPKLAIEAVATGEHWLGSRALELNLVDEIDTSDDYLLKASHDADIYEIQYLHKKSLSEKLSKSIQMMANKAFHAWQQEQYDSKLL